MWLFTLRDLQWRRRRFVLGVLGTAVVFALTLVLGGLTSALNGEADRAVQAVGADAWIVREGVSGPFSAFAAMPDTVVDQVARAPGVEQADPLITAFATTGGDRTVGVTVIGYRPGGMGPPVPVAGRQPSRANEALVDRATGYDIGDTFTLNGLNLTVVGLVEHMTLRGGVGDVYLNIRDAQAAVFKSNRMVTAVVTKGAPADAAALGLRAMSPDDVRDDVLRLFSQAFDAIDTLRVLLWLVALAVLAATAYLSALERVADLAVMKALGVPAQTLLLSVVIQALLVSLAAAALAVVAAHLIASPFPMPIHLSGSALLGLLALAGMVGTLAALPALHGAAAVDPAAAVEA